MRLVILPWFTLVSLNQDEDVINTNSQHQEGDDLEDDEGGGDSDEAEGSDAGSDTEEDNHDTTQTQGDLALNHEHGHLALVDLAQAEGDVHEHDDVGDC